PLYAGADSVELLKRTAKMVGDKGFILINADCTVIIDKPNISQVKSSMESVLSTAAGGLVTVCGKRTEGIGALGRGEGAVALAVALLGVK
ncbi:MAG: 2-C-methyl-D-erythritol 2,4-cyclodiphosphate synthase, partial [Candidatus Poriferisodalaceae bacterium]